jgi:hypothetical protein
MDESAMPMTKTKRTQSKPRSKSKRSTAKRRASQSHAKRAGAKQRSERRYWSARVARESDALDLESGVFKKSDPAAIARSLKRSAERSKRRKSEPYRSAMSMLTFYVNRAGEQLGARRRRVLERAKDELRKLFGRAPR